MRSHMRGIASTVLWSLLLLVAGAGDLGAQDAGLRVEDLAAAWSGAAHPACADAPGQAALPDAVRVEECTWTVVAPDARRSHVTGTRNARLGFTSVIWELGVANSTAAATIADSLSSSLRSRGLKEYECPDSARRWQANGMVVQYVRGAVGGDGLLNLMVFATTMPDAIPAFACPDAPLLPRAPVPPPRRDAAR